MRLFILILLTIPSIFAKNLSSKKVSTQSEMSKEVVENPTLKTLSGSLNQLSLYSTFTYRGGSLKEPGSAQRPNILKAEETPGLVDMSGTFGMKYRLSTKDNISLQVGLYSTTPFHSEFKSDDKKIQADYDKNGQNIDVDDPVLSYFRTYSIGGLQNISFVKYQYVTRGIYRDRGLRSAISYSHAAAYKITSFAYIAASLTYENYQYDRDTTLFKGRTLSLAPYQTKHKLRGNLTAETYLNRKMSLRFITDLFSYYRMRESKENLKRGLQQTIAMTYFFSRDISIAPNIRFLAEDIRADRTNMGLTLNLNI